MRVNAGLFKGRAIALPRGVELRPTSDKVKQALFNILAPTLPGARVLDLFCGSGALGLEALSRGAAHVVFVDKEKRCLDSVARILENIKADEGGDTAFLAMDARRALGQLASQGESFDLVLVDPPYDSPLGSSILQSPELVAILARDGLSKVVWEHDSRAIIPAAAGLEISKSHRYGSTTLSFFQPAQGRG